LKSSTIGCSNSIKFHQIPSNSPWSPHFLLGETMLNW
jgi:hypothetical protein